MTQEIRTQRINLILFNTFLISKVQTSRRFHKQSVIISFQKSNYFEKQLEYTELERHNHEKSEEPRARVNHGHTVTKSYFSMMGGVKSRWSGHGG